MRSVKGGKEQVTSARKREGGGRRGVEPEPVYLSPSSWATDAEALAFGPSDPRLIRLMDPSLAARSAQQPIACMHERRRKQGRDGRQQPGRGEADQVDKAGRARRCGIEG